MAGDPSKPYWVDDLQRKHEAYWYGDSSARTVTVKHEGRTLHVLIPYSVPLVSVVVIASSGEVLTLLGKTLDEEEENGRVVEGGDGVLIVARKHSERVDTYWAFVWHNIYLETLRCLGG